MKTVCFLLVIAFLTVVQGDQPIHQFCLEQLRKEYGNDTTSIDVAFSKTGEKACFDLKHHVARCVDQSLYSLVRVIEPQQLKDTTKVPYLTLRVLLSSLVHYMDVKKLPGFREFLTKCAHIQQTTEGPTEVVCVGDFTKKCACDLGNDKDCRAYKHIGEMFSCGSPQQLSMLL